jgi:hypothetical protein
MSENGFHVHGAHEHEIEHQAHHGPGLAQYVAIFTAVLSTIGAVISYEGGETQVEAMLYKNESILRKAQASDQWNFYQAKSSKGHLMELAMDLVPADKRAPYQQQLAKYEQQKKQIRAKAEALDRESDVANEESERAIHPHDRLARSMTMVQIAIALASVTALTRKTWLFSLAAAAAVWGIALWGLVLLGRP